MRPRIELDGATLRANVRAFAALGAPVAAVVKNDGYGWGASRIVREIDNDVESYLVADEDEFWSIRMHTRKPIRLLGPAAPESVGPLLAYGGIPNVTTPAAIDSAIAWARATQTRATIRVGIVDAAGWYGVAPNGVAAFAALCAAPELSVELWTHITSTTRALDIMRAFERAEEAFRTAGIHIVGTDVASTAWATPERARDRLRVGVGLFGVRLGAPVNTACAIRVDAPAVTWFSPGSVCWSGYGDINVPVNRGVVVLRSGYGDGIPKSLAGTDDILSVGMQYTTRLADEPTSGYALIDAASDLDRLASRAGMSPHELVVGIAQRT